MQPIGNNHTIIDVEGTAYVAPKRSWLVPFSMLLPCSINIRATIRLGVKGPLETGRVSSALSVLWYDFSRCYLRFCCIVVFLKGSACDCLTASAFAPPSA
jgi:hypothetical protein